MSMGIPPGDEHADPERTEPEGGRGGPDGTDAHSDERPEERPVDRFRRTAVGSVVAAGLLGLRDALEGRPEREEPAVVAEAPQPRGEPDFEVLLDLDRPGHGIVVLHRPLPRHDPAHGTDGREG
jgi:hypothetical protein